MLRFPKFGSRSLLIGSTGSGKTTLAKLLVSRFAHVLIYDVKGMMKVSEWPGFVLCRSFDDVQRKANQTDRKGDFKYPKIIYQPKWDEIPDSGDFEFVDKFFRFAYLRKNTLVYVDEVYGATHNQQIPQYLKAILTRGRERGITFIGATQRPKAIPVFLLSESENYYVFRLQMPQDIEVLERIKGFGPGLIRGLEKFEFVYADEFDVDKRKKKLKILK